MDCICCGSFERKSFASSEKGEGVFEIIQCKRCGLLYKNQLLKEMDLKQIYKNYEIPYHWEFGSSFFNREVTSLASSVTPSGGRVLEVGCAYGKILGALQRMGFVVKGVEASSLACDYIKKEYDFPIYEGLIEEYLEMVFDSQKFDTIIALNVIEHLQNPYTTMIQLDKILIPGGHVLIVVPDIALALLYGWIRKKLYQTDPYGIDSGTDKGPVAFNSPGHLYFFSRKTLRLLIERVGWRVVKHRHAPYVLSGPVFQNKKDLIKPVLYYLIRFFERIGIEPEGLSYSQLLLARKPC